MAEAWYLNRFDEIGELRYMTRSGGYVMCRRKGKVPFVISEKEWLKKPTEPIGSYK